MAASRNLIFRIGLVLSLFFALASAAAPISPTESELRAAVAQGGEVTFTQDGTILLTTQIEVRTNCIISGAGRNIIIDGGNTNRLFHVSRGVQLELRNLILQNARHAPPTLVAPDEPAVPGITATPARGGAILNEGFLAITDSTLQNCAALGGSADLGDSFVTSPSEAGSGHGGAIFNRRGTLVMQNVFITNCIVYGGRVLRSRTEPVPRGLASGGAIFNEHGFLHLTNVTFASNAATHSGFGFSSRGFATGGAIASSGGTNTITRSVFVNNEAEPPGTSPDGVGMLTTGGAIHQEEGTLVLDECIFDSNALLGGRPTGLSFGDSDGGDAQGGAIYSTGLLSVEKCSFLRNSAQGGDGGGSQFDRAGAAAGGAIYGLGPLQIVNSTLYRNEARGGGGDIPGAGLNPGSAYGGAIYASAGGGIINCTMSDNVSFSPDFKIDVVGVTNTAVELGWNLYSATNSFALKNTILHSTIGGTNFSGVFTDLGHNISSDNTPVLTAPTSRNNLDPLLGPLGYYSGSTLVFPLASGSPAIDAAEALPAITEDQRGRTRPFGPAPDIGAFESSPPYFIVGDIETLVPLVNLQLEANGEVFPLSPTNHFELGGFAAGDYQLSASADALVFRPEQQTIVIEADTTAQTLEAFPFNALTINRPAAGFEMVFAGESNRTYQVHATTNFQDWTTVLETNLPSRLLEFPAHLLTNRFRFFRVLQP